MSDGWLLSVEELEALTPEEAQEYEHLIDSVTSSQWSLDKNPKSLMLHLLAGKVDWTLGGGSAGGGKGLGVNDLVMTPFGPKLAGKIKVGDQVTNPEGGVSRVIAVYKRGVQPCWRVGFSDGAELVTDSDHLWAYRRSGKRIKRDIDWKIATTPQLAEMVAGTRDQVERGKRPSWPLIPLTEPVAFNVAGSPERWAMDPYVLGVLLADGSMSPACKVITFSKADMEVVERVQKWVAEVGIELVGDPGGSWRFRNCRVLFDLLARYDMRHRAEAKFVPPAYLVTPLPMRYALMQGLMDCDGYVDERGHASYSTASPQLASGVQWLARSLGFKATITVKAEPHYLDPEGNRVICQPSHLVTMTGRCAADLFSLPRKRDRCSEPQQPGIRRVVSVERTEDQETVCFTVDHPNGLFVAGDGFVVTHNSEALAYHARDQATRIPGSQTLVLRTSLPELRRSFILRTIVRFAQTGDSKRAKLAQRDNVRAWWFDNGSIIEFGFLNREEDASQYLSAEYSTILFDESTQFSPGAITMLTGRLRTTKALATLGARPHAVFASNPGDISHEWHKELFVDLTEYGKYVVVLDISEGFMDNDGMIDWDKCEIVKRVLAPQTPAECLAFQLETDPQKHLSIAFVPFKAQDNAFLDPSVMRGLNALPAMERRQKRDGDWDAFTGRYFTEFTSDHIVTPFEIPESWDKGIGADHGFSAPFAAIFGTWDNDGNCYIFDEVYQTKLTPQQQADAVKTKLIRWDSKKDQNVTIKTRTPVADPAAFHSKGEGKSIAEQWSAAGFHATAANNARIDGWMNVREYLRIPVTEEGVGKPKLFVFDTCTELIREFRNARQDPRRADDVDTSGSDHALDAVRYLLATRPRRKLFRQDPHKGLTGLELRESKRLEKYRKAGAAVARRLGLDT